MKTVLTLGFGGFGFIAMSILCISAYWFAPIVPCTRTIAPVSQGVDDWGMMRFSRTERRDDYCAGSEIAAYQYGSDRVDERRDARLLHMVLLGIAFTGGFFGLLFGGLLGERLSKRKKRAQTRGGPPNPPQASLASGSTSP